MTNRSAVTLVVAVVRMRCAANEKMRLPALSAMVLRSRAVSGGTTSSASLTARSRTWPIAGRLPEVRAGPGGQDASTAPSWLRTRAVAPHTDSPSYAQWP